MASDNETPEWTDEEIARGRPGVDVLPAALVAALKRGPGRPAGTVTSNKQQVTLRLDREAVDLLKAQGPGWQTRINDAVRRAAGL